jgi:hypothetical protein
MWPVRVLRKLRSRRPNDAPSTQPLQVIRDGVEETLELPIDQFPILLPMPIFEPPAYLSGRAYKSGINIVGIHTLNFGPKPDEVSQHLGVHRIRITHNQQSVGFARMLAKIGYSYAVAEIGINSFDKVFVLPAILGKVDDIGRWVGIDQPLAPKFPKLLHRLSLRIDRETRLLFAVVHLFADSESPSYLVVLGCLKKDKNNTGVSLPHDNCSEVA